MMGERNGYIESTSMIIQKRLRRANQYNLWIYESIAPYLGDRILDIGCSVGNIVALFYNQPRELVVGVDIEEAALRVIQRRLGSEGTFQALQISTQSYALRAFRDNSFDTITCLNVLEHVEDDRKCLKEMWRVVNHRGHVILYVPAFRFLMGTMDRADGHFRRYTRTELSSRVEDVGLRIVHARYMNLLGSIGWFVNGRIFRRRLIPAGGVLDLFDRLVPTMKRLEKLVRLPLGQSLLLTARKD